MYTMTNLLPYVGYMVAGFRGDHADGAGYAAGYVASSFYLGRLLSSYVWGFASDRLGRKHVMVISLVSIVIGSIFFGVSEGLVWAISVRLLMGLTNAATVVGRAVVPELCGSAGVVEGMGLVTGGYAVGLALGPALGGLLSEPVRYFPSLFSSDGFFARYPYVLPNVMGSLVALILIPLVILYMPETKKRKSCPEGQFPGDRPVTPVSTPIRMRGEGRDYNMLAASAGRKTPSSQRRSGQNSGVSPLLLAHGRPVASPMKEAQVAVEDNNANDAESAVIEIGESKIFGGLLQVRHFPEMLLATGLMEIAVVGFEEVYPLWAISSRSAGGLDWDIMRIGQVLFCAGVGQAVLMFVAHAWLVKWMGIAACHRGACALAALLNAAVPLIGYLRWSDTAIFILSSVTIAVLSAATYMVYSAVMVSATNPAPPRLRGILAGIMTTAQCLGGVLGPGTFAVLFAWSISRTSTARDIPLVDQHFVFNVGAILRIVLLALVWKSLTEESLTDVVEDPPTPQTVRAPTTELETARNGKGIKQGSLSLIGDKRSDLV